MNSNKLAKSELIKPKAGKDIYGKDVFSLPLDQAYT
jgi:hypothetical protein